MLENIFFQLIIIILSVALFGLVAQRFNQPLLIGYILAGMILGILGFKKHIELPQIEALANLGLTLLLFIVGLKLDISMIKTMGNSIKIGLTQVLITFALAFGISHTMQMNFASSFYISMALTFSSTIIIIKILSDKGELDSLSGRLDLGVLIIQDIVAIAVMIGVSSFSGAENISLTGKLFTMLKYAILIGLIIFSLVKFIFPKFLKHFAKSSEFLMVMSISLVLLLAGLCEYAGFSMEVGAFLAGMSLAPFKEYRYTISSKLSGLRDFMLIFFFLNLGLTFNISNISGALLYKAIVLTLFVLIIKPFIVMLTMKKLGYQGRTSFITGVNLAQISEFSIIVVEIGIAQKQINHDILWLTMIILIITTLVSSYLLNHSTKLYDILSQKINLLTWKKSSPISMAEDKETFIQGGYDTIIVGLGDFGHILSDRLSERTAVLEIDFDPLIVSQRRAIGKNIIYGDIEDHEFIMQFDLSHINWIISTLPAPSTTDTLLKALKLSNFKGSFATSTNIANSQDIKKMKGIDLVFEPYIDAAREAVEMIEERNEQIKKDKISKRVSELTDHYIVCGFGRMGRQIVSDLINENVPYVIVEENPEHHDELLNNDYNHVTGNASSDEVLIAAGIKKAKGLIAVYPSDESNVFIVLTARTLNPQLDIVARSIMESNEDKLKRAGANKVISPYMFGGRRIATAVLRPAVFEFNELTYHGNEFDIVFEELNISEKSNLIGKTIKDSDFRKKYGVTIIAIQRSNGEMIANPDHNVTFNEGDTIIVICSCRQLSAFRESDDFVVNSVWRSDSCGI